MIPRRILRNPLSDLIADKLCNMEEEINDHIDTWQSQPFGFSVATFLPLLEEDFDAQLTEMLAESIYWHDMQIMADEL